MAKDWGTLTDAQRATLMSVAEECPVRTTLQCPVEFQSVPHQTLCHDYA
jgi:hypothetical protein